MSGSSASSAFGTGPASGYSPIYIFTIYFYVIVVNACCVKTMDHAPVNIIMFVLICLIFRIKINRKIPQIPTDPPPPRLPRLHLLLHGGETSLAGSPGAIAVQAGTARV